MWLLENAGNALEGRRLWLRPGQRYLFGRTRAEPGQLVLADRTISRKHLAIEVGRVRDGDGSNCDSRSVVTVEDLGTKMGTVVDGATQIRGQRHVLRGARTTLQLGHMADVFTIAWQPVVLSFSFSSKELRATAADDPQNPWTRVRRVLEPLDVHVLAAFRQDCTTHVVAKKRNTSRGLQALVNGRYLVADSFWEAVAAAAASGALEADFDGAWPDALAHLPPRGDEPSDRPSSAYAPEARRAALFEGYTFVFYDEKQYANLLPPIADGRGKALLPRGRDAVVPGQTQVDDFVRYVKGVAGEQGTGEFEDGSAGRGVVVVRYVPAKGDHVAWFTRFTTAVALRLDHRLIDQREFLDAILAVEPSRLRRPLEVEAPTVPPGGALAAAPAAEPAAAAEPDDEPQRPLPPSMSLSQASSVRRARGRRGAATSRFRGFDADLDSDVDDKTATNALDALQQASAGEANSDGMFVSQQQPDAGMGAGPAPPTRRSKRGAAAASQDRRAVANSDDDNDDDDDGDEHIMDDIAPTAAAVKRRRIAAGVEPVPRAPSDDAMEEEEEEEEEEDSKTAATRKGKGAKGREAVRVKREQAEDDILGQARRNREAAERRLAEERQRLAELPDDGLDAAAIRRLTLVDTIAVRAPAGRGATSQGGAPSGGGGDPRWRPEWNGRRNFKRFRRPGDVVGRSAPRVIVGLEPAKTKEYGIGDGYWLEGGHGGEPPAGAGQSASSASRDAASPGRASAAAAAAAADGMDVIPDTDPDDDAEDADDDELAMAPPPPRPSGAAVGADARPLSVLSSNASKSSPQPTPDLPRTRAGKAAARAAVARQSPASQTRTPGSSAGGRVGAAGEDASMTSSSLLIFETPSASTQDSSTTRGGGGGGAKRPAATVSSLASPVAKRPRRGPAAGTASSSATGGHAGSTAAPVVVPDSDEDEDDGLTFKFRSRR